MVSLLDFYGIADTEFKIYLQFACIPMGFHEVTRTLFLRSRKQSKKCGFGRIHNESQVSSFQLNKAVEIKLVTYCITSCAEEVTVARYQNIWHRKLFYLILSTKTTATQWVRFHSGTIHKRKIRYCLLLSSSRIGGSGSKAVEKYASYNTSCQAS